MGHQVLILNDHMLGYGRAQQYHQSNPITSIFPCNLLFFFEKSPEIMHIFDENIWGQMG